MQPAATASHSSPKAAAKDKEKGKAPEEQCPPRRHFDSKKMTSTDVEAMTPEEIKDFATQMMEEEKEVKAYNLQKKAEWAAKDAAREAAWEAKHADEAAKKPSAKAGHTVPAKKVPAEEFPTTAAAKGKGRKATNPPASPPLFKHLRRGPQTQTQTTTPTQPIHQDFPSAYQIMSAEDASSILPKEYDTIFHDIPATWIQVNPTALSDVIFPIAHLPPFLHNLIAFHHEGRGSIWYRMKYFHSNDNPIKWFRRTHMSKATILRTFGKYLSTMSHTWNEAYCQNSFDDQDRLLMMQIEKHRRATDFNLSPEDPYRRGLRVPRFHEVKSYGVLYGQETDSSAHIMVDTILSAPSKVDLIALGEDLSSLSTEDAALMDDILAQLGGAKGSKAQGEPLLEEEPIDTSNAADSD